VAPLWLLGGQTASPDGVSSCGFNPKLYADAMVASAKAGKRTLIHFQEAGVEALAKLTRPQKRVWPRLLRKRTRAS
jgi:hypothetical protein